MKEVIQAYVREGHTGKCDSCGIIVYAGEPITIVEKDNGSYYEFCVCCDTESIEKMESKEMKLEMGIYFSELGIDAQNDLVAYVAEQTGRNTRWVKAELELADRKGEYLGKIHFTVE